MLVDGGDSDLEKLCKLLLIKPDRFSLQTGIQYAFGHPLFGRAGTDLPAAGWLVNFRQSYIGWPRLTSCCC